MAEEEAIVGDGEETGEAGESGGGHAGLRYRFDGFTPEKQKIFLKALRKTGCLTDAARAARVSCNTVRRTRRIRPEFDARCVAARQLALPALEAIAYRRATVGAPAKIIRKGKLFEVRVKPSDAMLRLLLAGAAPRKYGRYAGLAGSGAPKPPEEPPIEEVRDEVLRQVAAIRRHRAEAAAREAERQPNAEGPREVESGEDAGEA